MGDARFCSRCGTEVQDADASYCAECGHAFAKLDRPPLGLEVDGESEEPFDRPPATEGATPEKTQTRTRRSVVVALVVAAVVVVGVIATLLLTRSSTNGARRAVTTEAPHAAATALQKEATKANDNLNLALGIFNLALERENTKFPGLKTAEYYTHVATAMDYLSGDLVRSATYKSPIAYPAEALPEVQALLAATRSNAASSRALAAAAQGTRGPQALIDKFDQDQTAWQQAMDALRVKLNSLSN